ncbi:hypothetical protein [Piscibacillus salipiscarius]|uniref:Uncharacterized protein n=1 Tax=Piscibacillus salipiscarius TaxID=299480 RepID=A0ABW5Q7L8_9BACI|nr:hypothetical protein [Piscibacillus salipiscarius]
MGNIDVAEIASRLYEVHKPIGAEEIQKLVDERINGKSIQIENLGSEIMMMVAELTGKMRAQDYRFMIDLLQTTIDELQKSN